MARQDATTDELWARGEANGYKRGAHNETDKVRDAEKYVSKTKEDHDRTLHRYWVRSRSSIPSVSELTIASLPKSQRNQHIQDCVRREMASRLGRLLTDIHYC